MGSGAGAGLTSGGAEANVVGVEPEVLDGMVKALCAGLESGRSGGYDLIMFMMDESCRDLRPEHLDQMQAAALQFVASGHGGADVAAWLGEVLNSLNTARSRFSTRPYCEVLFFPSRDGVNPHKRLVQLLERARKSLDMYVGCMLPVGVMLWRIVTHPSSHSTTRLDHVVVTAVCSPSRRIASPML